MMEAHRKQSAISKQKDIMVPQVNIYNRHFYLRGAEIGLKQAQHEMQIKQLANTPKLSVSSYNIIIQQLQHNLLKSFTKNSNANANANANAQNSKQLKPSLSIDLHNTLITFTQFQKVVQQICGINEHNCKELEHFLSQLWLVLGGYQIQSEIVANVLYTTLRVLLDPYMLTVGEIMNTLAHIPQFSQADYNREKFLSQYPDPEVREQSLTVQQLIKLWKKIRISNQQFRKNSERNLKNYNNATFKPEINKKSQQLASKSLQKYLQNNWSSLSRNLEPDLKHKYKFNTNNNNNNNNKQQNQLSRYLDNSEIQYQQSQNYKYFSKPCYHDILFNRRLEKDQPKIKDSRYQDKSFEESRVSRYARPEEISKIVNNLYVVKQRKQDTDFAKLDQENQLKQCTFSPKINKNYTSTQQISHSKIKGYEKQVTRMQKGRQQKQRLKKAYQNLGRVKNPLNQNASKSPNKSIAPSFIDRDTPKLILQIKIDDERVEELKLKGNQNPHLVSKKFVIKHGLDDQMIQVLQALVQEQLENL